MIAFFKRIHWIVLIGLLGLVVVLVLVFKSRESAQVVGGRFMDALARHDVAALASLSYSQTKDEAQLRQEWDKAVNQVSRYYRFRWIITSSSQSSEKTAAVRLMMVRDYGRSSSYEEKFELPMIQDNGKWKVAVSQLNRKFFPGMPR